MSQLVGKDSTRNIGFNDLETSFQNIIKKFLSGLSETERDNSALQYLMDNPDLIPYKIYRQPYNSLRDEFLSKPLWTIGADGRSNTGNLSFSNVNISSQFLWGIIKNNQRTFTGEFDIKALYTFNRDSLQLRNNLDRQIFSIEPGVNFSLRSPNENKSYLEFKLSGSYYHSFSGLQKGARADSSTLNAEIRLRVFDDIWIPIVIKYDPENRNLFGLLNISTNFIGLRNLLNRKLE